MAAKVKVEKPELSPGAARRRLDAVLEQLQQRGREPLEEEPGKGPGETPAKEASPSAPGKSVELGQFPAGTPLYPVCRAWIGHSPAPAPAPEQAPPGSEDVLALPPPGPARLPRLPEPLGPEESAAPPGQGPDPAPSITSLIYRNMERWKRVRQRWREAAQRQQQRYGPSLRLLRLIYERQ